MGRMFRSLRGMSGSSILGNGEVALIFDVHSLCQLATDPPPFPAPPAAHSPPKDKRHEPHHPTLADTRVRGRGTPRRPRTDRARRAGSPSSCARNWPWPAASWAHLGRSQAVIEFKPDRHHPGAPTRTSCACWATASRTSGAGTTASSSSPPRCKAPSTACSGSGWPKATSTAASSSASARTGARCGSRPATTPCSMPAARP